MQNVGSELAGDSEVNIASKLASYIGPLTASPLRVSQTHFAWIRLSLSSSKNPAITRKHHAIR
jgi:hypothetical protein